MQTSNVTAIGEPPRVETLYQPAVEIQQFSRSVARRMLLNFPVVRRWQETEDICQEAALRLQKSLLAIEPKSRRHLENLVALQIRRTLIDMARKYRRTLDQGAIRWTPDSVDEDPSERLERSVAPEPDRDALQHWTALHTSVDTMSPELKEVFQLIWYAGHNKKQVAEIVGADIRTVQRRWRAARELLSDSVHELSLLR